MQTAFESLSTSDCELWRTFKAGDKTAFAQIYEQHAATLYNYGRHISPDEPLVKDCIQELFVELWNHRNNLGETDSIKFYLFKSLRRKIIYEAKRKSRFVSTDMHQPLSEAITVSLPYEFPHVETHLGKVHQQKLLHALEALPKRQREVIHLLFFDNLTRDEVASLMDIDLNSIYTLTWKALQTLKLKLLSASSLTISSSVLILLALCFYLS